MGTVKEGIRGGKIGGKKMEKIITGKEMVEMRRKRLSSISSTGKERTDLKEEERREHENGWKGR